MHKVLWLTALLAAVPAAAETTTLSGHWRYDFPATMFMGFDQAKGATCAAADPVINLSDPKAVSARIKGGWIVYAPTMRHDNVGPVTWKLWLVEPLQSKVAQLNAYTDVTESFPDPAAKAATLPAGAEAIADEAAMHWASERARGHDVKWIYHRQCA